MILAQQEAGAVGQALVDLTLQKGQEWPKSQVQEARTATVNTKKVKAGGLHMVACYLFLRSGRKWDQMRGWQR